MFDDDSLAGSWAALCQDVATRGCLARWAQREPALRAARTLDDLQALTSPRAQQDIVNDVLGATVRIAARDGGDDPTAVLVVVHLLSNGLQASAARIAPAVPGALSHLIAEVTGHIRTCSVTFPYRSYALQLIRKAEHSVLAERYPHYSGGHRLQEIPLDPAQLDEIAQNDIMIAGGRAALCAEPPHLGDGEPPIDPETIDPIDLVLWAVRTAVINVDDVELLLELDTAHRRRGASLDRVAARRQVCVRTLNRHQRHVEAALRAALPDYLSAVA